MEDSQTAAAPSYAPLPSPGLYFEVEHEQLPIDEELAPSRRDASPPHAKRLSGRVFMTIAAAVACTAGACVLMIAGLARRRPRAASGGGGSLGGGSLWDVGPSPEAGMVAATGGYPTSAAIAPAPASRSGKCPGDIDVYGFGKMSLIGAAWNTPTDRAGPIEVQDGVMPYMKSRAYFGNTCSDGAYVPSEYAEVFALGHTLSYTVDLSGVECGCNFAFYLTAMRQNSHISECADYYCDANEVCGVSCAEIDIMEASKAAWYSTLHGAKDRKGAGKGYGMDRRQWTSRQYGPYGVCIDTRHPFQVSASFHTNASGWLESMEVELAQYGKPCTLSLSITEYDLPDGGSGMEEMTRAMSQGMTPVISYWGRGADMQWLDGIGSDHLGPCSTDTPDQCSETALLVGLSLQRISETTVAFAK
mmetsp:Transcript_135710/g.343485  ORF Transcript_135710/g.343485 Transcript_135710/m.343485 type:complete len:417 (-) Transcript_135710:213-1463(-)|eukprot:CAMPEP_0115383228 /NCGR_PEP_ID=MMETSP0271-20121206/6489_1 /TAXON_ID=71861 /ORGANISM="Scrippsiella trochoidea, Strain CCMP3099" /LENGTH=416 /DNA_ID=CAMNT_0002806555 /DNA_START=15 /DNA_END=1265 /DNA_ORIENTATION=+